MSLRPHVNRFVFCSFISPNLSPSLLLSLPSFMSLNSLSLFQPQIGIETTVPQSSAHPQHQSVATLTATGVKVQRSQSFNAESSSNVQHKKSSPHSRVRSSARPKSYYENDGSSALVIGQPLLSFTQVQLNASWK